MTLPKITELEINAGDITDQTSSTTVHKTYLWDFTANDFARVDGKLVEVTGLEYIKVWVQKALRSVYDSLIYQGTNYGSEHHSLIGRTFKPAFAQAEYERMIREALLKNDVITRVDNFAFEQRAARLIVSFNVYSIYGVTSEEVAV